MADPPPLEQTRRASALRRWLPLALLAALLVAFFAFGLEEYLSFDALRAHRAVLTGAVEAAPVAASLVFVAAYALIVASSVPGAIVMTVAGGFFFGVVWGTALSVVGAMLGAVAVFLAARTAVGDALRRRAGPWLARMETGIRRDAFNYLLVLRLLPIAPFWLINLVPALLGVPLRTYALATLIGIVPGAVVYAGIGHGLGATLDAGKDPDLGIILRPEVLLPLIGLAVLALLPVAVRWARGWKRRA